MDGTKRIVFIDDEEDLTFFVKTNLEKTGRFTVVTTPNPQDAEAVIQRENPDLILVDNIMPLRRGSEVAQALKKNPATKKIPIIMISGKGEMGFNVKKKKFSWQKPPKEAGDTSDLPTERSAAKLAATYGVDDYIQKPFTTELLLSVIEDVLVRKAPKPSREEDII